ncbi:acetyltransferase (GNAT) family domain-containing protein [Ditylenchus destructor]|uniref:N-terminal amino-acid N(alpha)-acetyltransferase NatA n=1 Tax=Ditylenchus destructor TaxID=166010 RepID=A0AAD4MNL7_9BILA|nr:acetyltransferase (GNAT) family domain-containing protein [Ditylenchus destructor]
MCPPESNLSQRKAELSQENFIENLLKGGHVQEQNLPVNVAKENEQKETGKEIEQKHVSIRQMTCDDFNLILKNNNLLPGNCPNEKIAHHSLYLPQISYVAEDSKGNVVGYILAKMQEASADEIPHGHITSLAVKNARRRLKLAQRLLDKTSRAMIEIYNAPYIFAPYVRVSNQVAVNLYRNVLKFQISKVRSKYYADGEDAYVMKRQLGQVVLENGSRKRVAEKESIVEAPSKISNKSIKEIFVVIE